MADSQRKTANLVNISTYTVSGGQSSKYEYFTNVILSAGTYTFSCRQNNTLSSATRNTLFVVINSNFTYESTAADYHLNVGLHSLTFTLESRQTIMLGYWTNTLSNDCVYDKFMLNEGSTALSYEPNGWLHSLRKLTTSTDTITTLPADIYADGNNATVGISGNMEQSGTPTPDNPIQPQGTGERTGNLWDFGQWLTDRGATYTKDGDSYTFGSQQAMYSTPFYFSQTDIIISISGLIEAVTAANPRVHLLKADGTRAKTDALTTANSKYENVSCAGLIFDWSTPGNIKVSLPMLNTGSTALPYEPYGYKIPISSANTTTPVYLGEVETTRRIKKLVLTGEETVIRSVVTNCVQIDAPDSVEGVTVYSSHFQSVVTVPTETMRNGKVFHAGGAGMGSLCFGTNSNPPTFKQWLSEQYAAGTPVTVWYVLATPTTGIVNEPIRKIGDYADTVSGITIPTITGKDTVDVETTLKPSEVELTYTGWHDATVEEWDGSQWQ